MKKFNYNIILFAAAALLILAGWCSSAFFDGIKTALTNFMQVRDVQSLIDEVDEVSQNVWYKNSLIDANSLFYRVTNTQVVEKDDATVVKLDNDYLSFVPETVPEDDMARSADKCLALQESLASRGIKYLYVAAPSKAYFGDVPANLYSDTAKNFNDYTSLLRERGCSILDLGSEMTGLGLTMEDSFFITDHHWIPETGLWAAGKICRELNAKYGFEYDEALLSPSAYKTEVFEDCFLGSVGKKAGQYFTSLGLDDISLITPAFETSLTVTDSRGTQTGSFAETLIDESRLVSDDIYTSGHYSAYSGGDFPLQVIENHLQDKNAPTVLVIRDSYACVVTPFLSLVCDSLHIIDVRYWSGTGGAETVNEYIELISPDYVLVINSGVAKTIFDFE